MKTLFISISLLLTTTVYCFDTLSLKTHVQGIKTDAQGTTHYRYVNLPDSLGSYVLEINDVPIRLEADNFITTKGIQILEINWVEHSPLEEKLSNHELFDQMIELKERLRELEHRESEELKFRKELLRKMVDEADIRSIKELYKEKDISIKKERMRIYHELELIQNKINLVNHNTIASANESQNTLFLSILKDHLDAKILMFNYFLAHPEAEKMTHKIRKDSQLVKGRVIESESRVPMIYAMVEIYDGKELIRTLYTDEMGVFQTQLATNKSYSFVIHQEGYRNKKVKKFQAQQMKEANYRTYAMKEKDPLSFVEFASYALNIATILAQNW